MNWFLQNKKILVYIFSSIICSLLLLFITFWLINRPYRLGIPKMPEIHSLSIQLQDQINEADKKAHRNPSSDNLGNLGMVYHSSAYYDNAKECYKLAVKKNSSKWIWRYYLGYLCQEMGGTEEALSNFSAITSENPRIYHAWYYIGGEYQTLGETDKAVAAYAKILTARDSGLTENISSRNDLFPLQTYAKYQIARIYVNAKNLTFAEQTLKQITKNNQSFGPAFRLLGNIYNSKGDSSWSNYYSIRAKDLADFFPPVDTLIDKLAQISKSELYLLKQIDEAIKSYNPEWTILLLNNALTNIPNNKYLISKAIKLYLKLDNGNLALPLLKQHLSIYKTDVNELREVAGLLYDKGFYSQATDYYSQLLMLKPGDNEFQSSLASSMFDQGKKSEALSLLKKLLNDHKNNTQTLIDGIHFLIVNGETEYAKEQLTVLKQITPDNANVYKYTGMLAEMEENYTLAISSYEMAVKRDPNDIFTIQYLGDILIKTQQWKKALIFLRKSLEAHPNDPYLLERIGTILVTCPVVQLRNYRLAIEFSERAFVNIRSSPTIVISAGRSLAMAYASIGDKHKASTYLKITLNLARNSNYPNTYLKELEDLMQLPDFRN